MNHVFTQKILEIIKNKHGNDFEEIYKNSDLLKYINFKTRSVEKGSKSRGSFASLYAIFVLVEDYVNKEYNKIENAGKYSAEYEGAIFTDLFTRQRQLPFGNKLQNHALNHRMNEEFKRYFKMSEITPIIRDTKNSRYWISEKLLIITIGKKTYNIAQEILTIINEYVIAKKNSFEKFIKDCETLKNLVTGKSNDVKKYIMDLLAPNVDARIFEIVSYSILKYYYADQIIYFGFEDNNFDKLKISDKLRNEFKNNLIKNENPTNNIFLIKDNLNLFKTGRTNANDGGIDFVMKPIGRFFQVTETLDVKKYFLDIDKIERFPITFVVKSSKTPKEIYNEIKANASKHFSSIKVVIERYMDCIEEVINLNILHDYLEYIYKTGSLTKVLDEIVRQSKVEFNYDDPDEFEDEDETVN